MIHLYARLGDFRGSSLVDFELCNLGRKLVMWNLLFESKRKFILIEGKVFIFYLALKGNGCWMAKAENSWILVWMDPC